MISNKNPSCSLAPSKVVNILKKCQKGSINGPLLKALEVFITNLRTGEPWAFGKGYPKINKLQKLLFELKTAY